MPTSVCFVLQLKHYRTCSELKYKLDYSAKLCNSSRLFKELLMSLCRFLLWRHLILNRFKGIMILWTVVTVSSVHSFESNLPSIALIFGNTFYGRTDKFFQAEVLWVTLLSCTKIYVTTHCHSAQIAMSSVLLMNSIMLSCALVYNTAVMCNLT